MHARGDRSAEGVCVCVRTRGFAATKLAVHSASCTPADPRRRHKTPPSNSEPPSSRHLTRKRASLSRIARTNKPVGPAFLWAGCSLARYESLLQEGQTGNIITYPLNPFLLRCDNSLPPSFSLSLQPTLSRLTLPVFRSFALDFTDSRILIKTISLMGAASIRHAHA